MSCPATTPFLLSYDYTDYDGTDVTRGVEVTEEEDGVVVHLMHTLTASGPGIPVALYPGGLAGPGPRDAHHSIDNATAGAVGVQITLHCTNDYADSYRDKG